MAYAIVAVLGWGGPMERTMATERAVTLIEVYDIGDTVRVRPGTRGVSAEDAVGNGRVLELLGDGLVLVGWDNGDSTPCEARILEVV